MNLLTLEDVEKRFDADPLFSNVTMSIESEERIGLVGRNGAGKSVLLKLLTGELLPDSGRLSRSKSLSIATLEQNPTADPKTTLTEYLHLGSDPHIRLARQYADALAGAGQSKADDSKIESLTARMEEADGFTMESRYYSLLGELGMTDPGVTTGTLSGGMLRKAALARCLAGKGNLLLLDEPTNHLDIESIEWLEKYIVKSDCAVVLVTHDRYFLESICTVIVEIEGGGASRYSCAYSEFLRQKQQKKLAAQAAENRRRVQLESELKWLMRGARARTGKEKARKNRADRLMSEEPDQETSMATFSSAHRRLGKKVLEIADVEKSYDEQLVISPFTYSFRKGERLGIIGPNGSGKSTFLNLIAGVVEPDGGGVVSGDNTVFAYFDQIGGRVDPGLSVLDYIRDQAERIQIEDGHWASAEQFLERFLFPRDMFNQSLDLLSGGEFRRLFLVRLLATSPNFLLLDEPTNDLDIDTIRLLEEYLAEYPGCILAVSHDRAFLDRVTDGLLIFDGNGGIQNYGGSYSEYATERDLPDQQDSRSRQGKQVRRESTAKLTFREKKELESLPAELEALEAEKATLEGVFQNPGTSIPEMTRANTRYAELSVLIDEKSNRWLELAEKDQGESA